MKINPDWKKSWKWFSIWAFAVGTALQLTYDSLDSRQKETLSPVLPKITAVVLVLGAVGRVVKQFPEEEK